MQNEFSTVDGFVEISECMAEMIKYIANEPSLGLFYIQKHTQSAVPYVVNIKNNVKEKSHETTLHTEDLEDSISMVKSMKQCGLSIADEMIGDIKKSLLTLKTKKAKRGLIHNSTSDFQTAGTSSSSLDKYCSSQGSGESSRNYLSTVFQSTKQGASGFKWPHLAFSILVSASPVLVCTAVLLGTLLSFGQPNLPDIETEEKVSRDFSPFQTEFPQGSTVYAEREENYALKLYAEERGFEEASLGEDKVDKVEGEDFPLSYVPSQLDDKNSLEIGPENPVNELVDRGFGMWEVENRRVVDEESAKNGGVTSDGEAIENDYVFVQKVSDESGEIKSETSPQGSVDAFQEDHLEISPGCWKQVKKDDDDVDDEEEDDSFDSSSDGAESSSPDASMTDILPVLDELHPLLDPDAPKPTDTSHDVSYAASEHSHGTSDSSVESDEDTESQEETKGVEEDGVDKEEEEKRSERKDDDSKSAIKWTEDDQKNLMDLGSSELERNQRLEHLIARRVARKTLRLLTEKNLIDLDSTDLPFNVPPISTARRNPFDFPDASYGDMGLPPIPGSAPSIMQPRRNPFDIPYDPNEEKPDLKGDSFQQEFMNLNQKEPFFKRHESFSVGPSGFGNHRHQKQDINWRPVFVPERFSSEETSYPAFQRQSSEMSDSKMSSVPDTESVSSAEQDEQKLNDRDFLQEQEMNSNIDHISDQLEHTSQSSGYDDVDVQHLGERSIHQNEVEITLGGVESPSEFDLSSEMERITPLELSPAEDHLISGLANEESSSMSSQSLKSEVIGNLPDDRKKDVGSSQVGDHHLLDSRMSTAPSVGESEFSFFTGDIETNQNREPVYDHSPPAVEKFLSFSPVSSDSSAEIAEKGLPAASTREIASVGDLEPESGNKIEGEKIQSSDYDEDISSEIHGDNNPNLASESTHHDVPLKKESLSGLKNNLSSSDEPAVSQSFDGFDKSQNLSFNLREKSQGTSISHDESAQEVHDVMHKPVPHISSLSYDSSTTFVGCPEFRTPTGEYESVGRFGSDNHRECQGAECSVKDEIKGIDEQILLELDTVGDFSVRDVDASSDSESKLEKTSNKSIESGPVPENLSTIECKLDFPVLEARSLEDIDLTFKQLQEGVDVKEVILPSSINDQLVLEETTDGLKNEFGFHVVEARSIDDINVALKQISEDKIDGRSKLDSNHDCDGLTAKEGESSKLIDSSGAQSGVEMNRTAVDKTEERSKEGLIELSGSGSDVETNITPVDKTENISKEEGSSKLIESSDAGSGVEVTRTAVDKTQEISKEEGLIESSGSGSGVEMNTTPVDKIEHISKEGSSKLIESSDAGSGVEVTRTPVDTTQQISEKSSMNIELNRNNTCRSDESDSDPRVEETNTNSMEFDLPLENTTTAEGELDLPVLEAKSHEDINLAFRQLHEGVDVKEVILPSSIKDHLVSEETERDLKNQSDFHVIEATSIDDIDVALKQISESKMSEQPKHDFKYESNGAEAKEGESLELMESIGTGSGVESKIAEQPKHVLENDYGGVEATEGESLKVTESSDTGSGVEVNEIPVDRSEEICEDTSVKIDLSSSNTSDWNARPSASSSSSSSSSDSD